MNRVCVVALAAGLVCGASTAAPAAFARPRPHPQRAYIAIGDSVTVSTAPKGGSFAPRLYRYLRRKSHGGANRFVVLASLRARNIVLRGDALDRAIRLIKGRSDVVAVTLTTGGNDALEGACWTGPGCAFPSNLNTILRRLNGALKHDPGRERLELLAYYNPGSGLGPNPTDFLNEPAVDQTLLGSDLRIDCTGSGTAVGLNDDIACIGWRNGWIVVDAWPAFKAGGRSLMQPADVHPNSAGHAVLARLFENACRLPTAGPGVADPDGFLAARPARGGRGCVGVK